MSRFCVTPIIGLALVSVLFADERPVASRKRPHVPLPTVVPTPVDNPTTPEKVALGRRLFFDPRLSAENTMSCATCHQPERAFGDGLPRARSGERTLARNTPTVLNVAWLPSYFWDGRTETLEAQSLGPIQSPEEMNQDLAGLEQELAAVPDYVRQFQAAFGSGVSRDAIAKALAAYQRTLVAADSPFDRFLAGDRQALTPEARRGYELFLGDAGCVRCHHGPLLTDGKFHRLGIGRTDLGRAAVTGKSDDRYRFRTPPLRNIADTAPYMHDGSLKTLDDVVQFYYRGVPARGPENLPLDVSALQDQSFSDMPAIVAFLRSLSGRLPADPGAK